MPALTALKLLNTSLTISTQLCCIMMRLLPLLLTLLLAAQAQAGAWPRQKGSGFASAAVRLSWPQDVATWTSTEPTSNYYTTYLEYGLTERYTIGFDMGHSVSGSGKKIAFLQMPLRQRDQGPVVSGQLGFGQISGDWVLRPGVSLGWGRPKGWISVDSVAEIHLDTGETDIKLDMTWGRNLPRDRKLIVQFQTGQTATDPAFARIAPSLVTPLGKRMKMETGATWGLTGDSSMGLKMGIWMDF